MFVFFALSTPAPSFRSTTSEATTIQLEFKDLAHTLGDNKYSDPVVRVMDIVHGLPKKDGLVPIFINAITGLAEVEEGSQHPKIRHAAG